MPSTYTKITSTALSSAASVTFSSIPATYTDLRIVVVGSIAAGAQNMQLQFNGITTTTYSRTFMGGSGSGFDTARESNYSYITLDRYGYFDTNNSNYLIDVMNYSNATTNKALLSRSNNGANGTGAVIGLWRSTAAISSIYLYITGSSWTSGSVATLYGIKAA